MLDLNDVIKEVLNEDTSELEMGIKDEAEHRPTFDWVIKQINSGKPFSPRDFFTHIAQDHLNKDKNYYSKMLKKEGN